MIRSCHFFALNSDRQYEPVVLTFNNLSIVMKRSRVFVITCWRLMMRWHIWFF